MIILSSEWLWLFQEIFPLATDQSTIILYSSILNMATLASVTEVHTIFHTVSRLLHYQGFLAAEARRCAQFDDHIEHWVRSLSRSALVERSVTLWADQSSAPECLPSLAMLQGLVTRCAMSGEVLSRSAPGYIGQLAAIFHKQDKGFKILLNQ